MATNPQRSVGAEGALAHVHMAATSPSSGIGQLDVHGNLALSMDDLAAIFAQGNVSYVPTAATSLRCSTSVPYPVVARENVLLKEITDALRQSPTAALLADVEASEHTIWEAVQARYADHPQAAMARFGQREQAAYAAVSIAFAERKGRILRATDALESLLMHTDIDTELPTALFQPPHPALYVHFGPLWRSRLQALLGPFVALCGDVSLDRFTVHGCYVLQSRHLCAACESDNRKFGLYLIVEYADQPGLYSLCGAPDLRVHDEHASLRETLIEPFQQGVPDELLLGPLPGVLVDLLAKLFLYMQSEGARSVLHNEYSELQQRLTLVGTKKLGKLQRKAERLVDWTEIGPQAWPVGFESGEVGPHWRRGHLRQQAHGPNFSLRKVIFVAPTLVRADKLRDAPLTSLA